MTDYTYSQIEIWVKQYAPRVVFHPDEIYYPSNAEWFLNRTSLVTRTANDVTNNNDCKNQDTLDTISPSEDCQDFSQPSKCSYFNISPESFDSTTEGDLSTATCYVHVLGVKDYIELQYLFFEPFNGNAQASFEAKWFGKSSTVDTGPVGSHQGDWEHITVKISNTGDFIGAFYAQHSHGTWLSPSTIRFVEGKHPVVYAALQTHASYGAAGVFTLYDKKNGVLIDPSVTVFGVKVGGADVTGNGKKWDTWASSANSLQILKIDGLVVSGDQTVSPSWLDFQGLWGGPYEYHYSFADISKRIGEFVWAFIKANPLVAPAVLAFASFILSIIGSVSIIAAIATALGISAGVLVIGVQKAREFLTDGSSLGPTGPTRKGYWQRGESTPYNIGVTTMKNGSSKIKIKFSPSLALTSFSSTPDENSLYAFYADRNNTFYYEKSGNNGVGWSGRKKVSSVDIHGSPAALFYKSKDQKFLYAFFQDKNSHIRYSVSSNGSSWSNHTLSYKMQYNSGMSVTLRGNQIYVVYADANKNLCMLSGTIDEKSAISNWNQVPVDSSIGSIDTVPYITTYNESLFVTYIKDGVSYMWQCYSVVNKGDDGLDAELHWGGPSIYTSGDLPSGSTPQPAVVNDQLFLIFSNNSVPSGAVTNIFGVSTSASDDPNKPNTYTLSPPFPLGISLRISHNMGLASTSHNSPLYLALRKDNYLYTSASYIA